MDDLRDDLSDDLSDRTAAALSAVYRRLAQLEALRTCSLSDAQLRAQFFELCRIGAEMEALRSAAVGYLNSRPRTAAGGVRRR